MAQSDTRMVNTGERHLEEGQPIVVDRATTLNEREGRPSYKTTERVNSSEQNRLASTYKGQTL